MHRKTSPVYVHGEGLLRFPGLALILYQLLPPDGLSDAFDKNELFSRLIGSEAYQHQSLNHSYKGEHGPFDVAKLRPEHYELISWEELEQTLSTRVIPASEAELDRYLDPWPSPGVLRSRLKALLRYIQGKHLHCYELTIRLENESYWSDRYREVPILDYFEEWVVVDTEMGVIHMLQLIQD